MEVGEYIRTKSGCIGNIININGFRPPEAEICVDMNLSDYVFISEEDIKSHSKNIIDLIETGDIVNGFKIYNMEYITYNNHIDLVFTIFKTPIDFTSPYKVIATWQEKDIKSILTHEMYEQNCYKVGED